MIKFQILEDKDFNTYVELFKNIFGYWDNNQRPNYIIAGLVNDTPVGFASFIRTHIDTVYLQYCGVLKEQRGRTYWKLLAGAIDQFPETTKYVVCRISNKNTSALIIALKHGFKIIGFRSTTQDDSLVELIKER